MDKNFFRYLYSETTVQDMLDRYCVPMLRSDNKLTRLKAKNILQYWNLLNDKAFFDKRIQQVFFQLFEGITNNFPDITYELSGRVKGLISMLNKVEEIEDSFVSQLKEEYAQNPTNMTFEEFLNNYDFGTTNPFDRIHDLFAFRIIIEDDGQGGMIKELYQITNFVIEFFNSSTFEVIQSYPLREVGPLEVSSPLIFIPKKSGIKEKYQDKVKDYVATPKQDGYQSVHFVVYDPYTERHFEVQVRTRSMDIISRTLANHTAYKKRKYGKRQEQQIDYSKIHVKGFRYFSYQDPITGQEKEYISDKAGITRAIPIKLEFEHFLTM